MLLADWIEQKPGGEPGRIKENNIKMHLSKVDPQQGTAEWLFFCVKYNEISDSIYDVNFFIQLSGYSRLQNGSAPIFRAQSVLL